MLGKTIKTVIALLFIPVAIAATKAFMRGLEDLNFLNFNLYFFIAGFFSYPIFQIVFVKPMYIYALGHEIVHVIATWLSAGKITSFHVSSAGGNVTTTKTNLFIRLSPYFVPIHVIFVAFLYWVLLKVFHISGLFNEFIFLLGFTLSMHIFMTIEVMKMRQPDIIKTGYLFSVLLIYIANIAIVVLALDLILGGISIISFAKRTLFISQDIYIAIFENLFR